MTNEEKKRRTKKIKSVRHLAQNIHKLRNAVRTDMRSDDERKRLTALAVALMDKTAERVGNEASARENGHFGVTGFRNNHVEVNGNNVKINYFFSSLGIYHLLAWNARLKNIFIIYPSYN